MHKEAPSAFATFCLSGVSGDTPRSPPLAVNCPVGSRRERVTSWALGLRRGSVSEGLPTNEPFSADDSRNGPWTNTEALLVSPDTTDEFPFISQSSVIKKKKLEKKTSPFLRSSNRAPCSEARRGERERERGVRGEGVRQIRSCSSNSLGRQQDREGERGEFIIIVSVVMAVHVTNKMIC